ncbi:DNA cytosine methyltransferase [Streptomyces spiramyceticus]|uniref:DNA cytosine methyltransferase n=1 Tax=Streptomyces spiramyceticus TaxID=299717 RepID=UPI00237B4017|nr:DNA cytosine methyltransferase [Streptomyces spiramyceticus]
MNRVIDMLCGAGGSSTGLVEAGYELILGINHWQLAIDTHAANHPNADHLTIDISGLPMRHLPKADVLWASVICTEISPAGGRRRESKQLDLLDQLDDEQKHDWDALTKEAFERTRVTAWCVVRAAEAKRFKAVIVENVIEFASDWLLFPVWLDAMEKLGYRVQIVSVSSAHVGDEVNLRAPQWRDRLYCVFTRKSMRKPDLEPRPPAYCPSCGEDVPAVQSWFQSNVRVGKYRRDYDYRCPQSRCGRTVVEPYVRPAADIINWQDIGTRIGDRKKPLVPTTMARIAAGLVKFPHRPSSITLTHGRDGTDRAYAVEDRPLPTRTAKQGDALLVPTGGSWNTEPAPVDVPLRTRLTRESEALVTTKPFIVEFRRNSTSNPVTNPMAGITAKGNHHGLVVPDTAPSQETGRNTLVIPYRKSSPKTAAESVHTLSTRDSAALVRSAPAIEDCYFRMLKPREQLLGQRFPEKYVVYGNQAEQTMQAGNAVSCNVARWIGERLKPVL